MEIPKNSMLAKDAAMRIEIAQIVNRRNLALQHPSLSNEEKVNITILANFAMMNALISTPHNREKTDEFLKITEVLLPRTDK